MAVAYAPGLPLCPTCGSGWEEVGGLVARCATGHGYSLAKLRALNGDGSKSPNGFDSSRAEPQAYLREETNRGLSPLRPLPFQNLAAVMAETPTQPDWLWTGFLAREAVTLLAGRPKVGKSTLVFGLLGALGTGATFSGTATSCTRVVLLTEERQTTLSDKVCGKIEHVDVLFRHDARGVPFSDIVEQTVDHAAAKGAGLVVVDTLGDWAALAGDSENSAGAILQAMRPVQEAAASGLAVLLVAHQRKAAGAHGDAVRGSNALTGAVDVVLELERPVGGVTTEANRRVLHATSRFSATPRELVLDLTDDGYTAQGTSVDASASDERERILDWLAQGGPATTEEVATGLNLPPARTAKRLNELRTDGRVQRSGDGRRGSPYTWRV